MAPLFRIKICGITELSEALLVAAAGGDAIGLNFYAASPRFISPDIACRIARALPPGLCKVGVFVNSSAADIARIAAEVGLDAIQLHGDEPPETLAALRPWKVVRAFRIGGTNCDPVLEYLARCQVLGTPPASVLVDAFQADKFGGTGKQVAAGVVRVLLTRLSGLPLILAGGLTPENVADVVMSVRPDGVDTASGVEVAPGRKDPDRVREFITVARAALAAVHRPPA